MDRAGRDDDVQTGAMCVGERFDGRVDVIAARAGERGDGRPLRPTRATARIPSKSPGEEIAKPASITSTPSRSSCSAISAFSCGCSAMPGDCSPSRSVVSKIVILRVQLDSSSSGLQSEAHLSCGEVGVCASKRVVENSP